MRFRFCGGLEPPDWLLAEIPLLAELNVERVTSTCSKLSRDDEDVEELLRGNYKSAPDATAATAVLRFVLFQAAKYDISDRELAVELLQLGMTSPTAEAIAAVYESERENMRKRLESRSFKFPTIEQLRWRIQEQGTDDASPEKTARVELRLQLDREALPCERGHQLTEMSSMGESLAFSMTEDKFYALYEELTQAHAILQSLSR